jgi:S-adenosylmethionine:diacylglycerol 3-amino-3-carboxypropyl transferase
MAPSLIAMTNEKVFFVKAKVLQEKRVLFHQAFMQVRCALVHLWLCSCQFSLLSRKIYQINYYNITFPPLPGVSVQLFRSRKVANKTKPFLARRDFFRLFPHIYDDERKEEGLTRARSIAR